MRLGWCLALLCCAALPALAGLERHRLDENTEYQIEDQAGGFDFSVSVSKYQFAPDDRAITQLCVSAVEAISRKEANARQISGKLDVTRRIGTDRNRLLGMTTCTATATVRVAKDPSDIANSPVLKSAMTKASTCYIAMADVYSATNADGARTVAEAVCATCAVQTNEVQRIARDIAATASLPMPRDVIGRDSCMRTAIGLVMDFRAKRALKRQAPQMAPKPKDGTI